MLNAERNASPRHYADWDPNDAFCRQCRRLNAEQREALQRQASVASGGTSDSVTSSMTASASPRIANIRTASSNRPAGSRLTARESHPDALARIETHRTQHSRTVGETGSRKLTSKEIPVMGAGKPHPDMLPEREEYVVEFDGPDDPRHAQNWPLRHRLFLGAILTFDAVTATIGSSIFNPAIPPVPREFHVAKEVSTLGITLFVLGYAFGPIMWAPG